MIRFEQGIIQSDLAEIVANDNINWNSLYGKSVLVTGANGMLATYIVYVLAYLNAVKNAEIRIIALSRNGEQSKILFAGIDGIDIMSQDICDVLDIEGNVDYVFHLAGNASPYFIQHEPVGILKSNILGTTNVLELARTHATKRVFFASTREVYGEVLGKEWLDEQSFGKINPLESRNCYPESKRAAESLMMAYHNQYGIDFISARIAHSYGPGMKLSNDGRVMADFMDCAVNHRDIVLHSKGDAVRAFCYITDSVKAIFMLMLNAEPNKAYNVANEKEPETIKKVAEMLCSIVGGIKVVIDIPETANLNYCQYKRVGLDTHCIESMGWQPSVSLADGLKRTVSSFAE